jgi:hypothetical protein
MRPSVIGAALVLLLGCASYERRPHGPSSASSSDVPAGILSEEDAREMAFRLCSDRALRVDRVEHQRLDASGRWHLTLAGFADRAQVILDGRDGTLLKGRFYREDAAPPSSSPSSPVPSPPKAAPSPRVPNPELE